jgi:hypothetical protein
VEARSVKPCCESAGPLALVLLAAGLACAWPAPQTARAEPAPRRAPAANSGAAPSGADLSAVPAGQILVVHVPEAGRVMAQADALLATLHADAAANPLRILVDGLRLNQDLSRDSEVTLCIGPPARLGGPPVRAVLVTRLDPVKAVGATVPDAAGIYHRAGGQAVMVLVDRTLIFGDAEALAAMAGAARGLTLSRRDQETLLDADVMVLLDPALLLRQYEPRYQAFRADLAARLAQARRDDAPKAAVAMLEARLQAAERLWTRAMAATRITAGLIVNDHAVDLRTCLTVAEGSSLGKLLSGHPALAGELNPPFGQQEFAALAYAAMDGKRLAGLLQWGTDSLVDAILARWGEVSGLGPAEIEALRGVFDDYAAVLGGQAGLIVPLAEPGQPVLEVDGCVELKSEASGAAWRGQVPATLDALTYLARVVLRCGLAGPTGVTLESTLDPAVPGDKPPMDHWRLSVALSPAETPDGQPTPQALQGLDLWNMASRGQGYFSVAPSPDRAMKLMAEADATALGQAGSGERATEALRHVLRRSNAVVVFSPSVLAQLWSRAVLRSYEPPPARASDVAIVPAQALAALSFRGEADGLSARLYIPVTELEPVFSMWRAFALLSHPAVGPDQPPVVP